MMIVLYEQHIDKDFKEKMINEKKKEKKEIEDGLNKMEEELNKTQSRISEISKITKDIQDNSLEINKIKYINTRIRKMECKIRW